MKHVNDPKSLKQRHPQPNCSDLLNSTKVSPTNSSEIRSSPQTKERVVGFEKAWLLEHWARSWLHTSTCTGNCRRKTSRKLRYELLGLSIHAVATKSVVSLWETSASAECVDLPCYLTGQTARRVGIRRVSLSHPDIHKRIPAGNQDQELPDCRVKGLLKAEVRGQQHNEFPCRYSGLRARQTINCPRISSQLNLKKWSQSQVRSLYNRHLVSEPDRWKQTCPVLSAIQILRYKLHTPDSGRQVQEVHICSMKTGSH